MKRLLALVLFVGLAGLGIWLLSRSSSQPKPPPAVEAAAPARTSAPAPRIAGPTPGQGPVANGPFPPPASPAPTSTVGSNGSPSQYAAVAPLPAELASLPESTVLENMRAVIRLYGAQFGGNPVGTNEEITRALQGDNPKHINFLKADGNRVNAAGELVDIWGTPYFFHQLSGTEMEIRSAGPDRRMWTVDDLITR